MDETSLEAKLHKARGRGIFTQPECEVIIEALRSDAKAEFDWPGNLAYTKLGIRLGTAVGEGVLSPTERATILKAVKTIQSASPPTFENHAGLPEPVSLIRRHEIIENLLSREDT